MFEKIAGTLALLIIAVLGYALSLPDTFRVERTISIRMPPEKIYARISDFRRWEEWSPWEKLDPMLKRTYRGLMPGRGSAYSWEGNDSVGAGNMEIVVAEPPNKIGIKLDITRPFEAHNTAEFTLTGKGDTTDVTWAMVGPSPYSSKLMSVFFSMDRMVGRDFEKGLANLKEVVEKPLAGSNLPAGGPVR